MIRILTSRLLVGLFALTLAGGVSAQEAATSESTGHPLSGDEVKELFTGNTERAKVYRRGSPNGRVYSAYFKDDGTYVIGEGEKGDGFRHGGVWFVDPLGRHCFRPSNKEKTKCDVILREADGYVRLRDGDRRGTFTIEKGNSKNL